MQNTKIVFIGVGDTPYSELECSINKNDLQILISHIPSEQWQRINLNKATAIKLVKVLKSEISKMEG